MKFWEMGVPPLFGTILFTTVGVKNFFAHPLTDVNHFFMGRQEGGFRKGRCMIRKLGVMLTLSSLCIASMVQGTAFAEEVLGTWTEFKADQGRSGDGSNKKDCVPGFIVKRVDGARTDVRETVKGNSAYAEFRFSNFSDKDNPKVNLHMEKAEIETNQRVGLYAYQNEGKNPVVSVCADKFHARGGAIILSGVDLSVTAKTIDCSGLVFRSKEGTHSKARFGGEEGVTFGPTFMDSGLNVTLHSPKQVEIRGDITAQGDFSVIGEEKTLVQATRVTCGTLCVGCGSDGKGKTLHTKELSTNSGAVLSSQAPIRVGGEKGAHRGMKNKFQQLEPNGTPLIKEVGHLVVDSTKDGSLVDSILRGEGPTSLAVGDVHTPLKPVPGSVVLMNLPEKEGQKLLDARKAEVKKMLVDRKRESILYIDSNTTADGTFEVDAKGHFIAQVNKPGEGQEEYFNYCSVGADTRSPEDRVNGNEKTRIRVDKSVELYGYICKGDVEIRAGEDVSIIRHQQNENRLASDQCTIIAGGKLKIVGPGEKNLHRFVPKGKVILGGDKIECERSIEPPNPIQVTTTSSTLDKLNFSGLKAGSTAVINVKTVPAPSAVVQGSTKNKFKKVVLGFETLDDTGTNAVNFIKAFSAEKKELKNKSTSPLTLKGSDLGTGNFDLSIESRGDLDLDCSGSTSGKVTLNVQGQKTTLRNCSTMESLEGTVKDLATPQGMGSNSKAVNATKLKVNGLWQTGVDVHYIDGISLGRGLAVNGSKNKVTFSGNGTHQNRMNITLEDPEGVEKVIMPSIVTQDCFGIRFLRGENRCPLEFDVVDKLSFKGNTLLEVPGGTTFQGDVDLRRDGAEKTGGTLSCDNVDQGGLAFGGDVRADSIRVFQTKGTNSPSMNILCIKGTDQTISANEFITHSDKFYPPGMGRFNEEGKPMGQLTVDVNKWCMSDIYAKNLQLKCPNLVTASQIPPRVVYDAELEKRKIPADTTQMIVKTLADDSNPGEETLREKTNLQFVKEAEFPDEVGTRKEGRFIIYGRPVPEKTPPGPSPGPSSGLDVTFFALPEYWRPKDCIDLCLFSDAFRDRPDEEEQRNHSSSVQGDSVSAPPKAWINQRQ